MHPSTARLYTAARDLMDIKGPSALARLIEESPQTIKNWETRGVSKAGAIKAQNAMGCDAHWILEGRGKMLAENTGIGTRRTRDGAELQRIPLVDWSQAASFAKKANLAKLKDATDWVDVHHSNTAGDNVFALIVQGDSMTNPHPGEITFPEGSIIVVNPDVTEAAGDFVVAEDADTQHATFKRLVRDGGRWFLQPLNPVYPTLEIKSTKTRVIGKVTDSVFRRKL